jgi:hypothetical protein
MMKELFTPEYAPCILAVNALFLAGCLCPVYYCWKYIPNRFEECKKNCEKRNVLCLVALLVCAVVLMAACLYYSISIGLAVSLLGFEDSIAYAFWNGGFVATVAACIVGWHKRTTKTTKSHARDR